MSFVQDITLPHKDPLTAPQKKEAKEKLDKAYKEESKLVKGVFKNLESPGSEIEFSYKKYPQDPIRKYTLKDGESYEIPLYLARHLNNDCRIKQSSNVVDVMGNRTVKPTPIQRYQFLSTEFM